MCNIWCQMTGREARHLCWISKLLKARQQHVHQCTVDRITSHMVSVSIGSCNALYLFITVGAKGHAHQLKCSCSSTDLQVQMLAMSVVGARRHTDQLSGCIVLCMNKVALCWAGNYWYRYSVSKQAKSIGIESSKVSVNYGIGLTLDFITKCCKMFCSLLMLMISVACVRLLVVSVSLWCLYFCPCCKTKSIWKMLGPFATASRLTPIHQGSLAVLLRATCASMSTTSTTTTHDRGDRYYITLHRNYLKSPMVKNC